MIIILQMPVDVVSIFLAAAVHFRRPEKILLQYAVKGHNIKCRYVYYEMEKNYFIIEITYSLEALVPDTEY
jgi:hypothetical protein